MAEGREHVEEESDTEPDQDAARWRAGWTGHGDPLFVEQKTSPSERWSRALLSRKMEDQGSALPYFHTVEVHVASTPFAEEKVDKAVLCHRPKAGERTILTFPRAGRPHSGNPALETDARMLAAGEYPDTGVAEFAKGRHIRGRALQVRFADWPTARSPTTYFSGSS